MSSRYFEHKGKIIPNSAIDPSWDDTKGSCGWCGGSGVRSVSIDREQFNTLAPCYICQEFCKKCNKWVKKGGHQCQR